MIAQIIRWLILIALLAAVLVAVFVAWWLALLIVLAALIIGAARRVFSGKPNGPPCGDPVILEGEYTEVEPDARPRPRDHD